MLRDVYLEGELGEKFGKVRRMEASSFEDALRCLSGNFDDFKTYLAECYEKGIYFYWKINDHIITNPDELFLQYPEGAMVITPVPAGAGLSSLVKGALGIIAGVALVITGGALIAGVGLFGLSGATAFAVGAGLQLVGQFLFAAGLLELLSEDPATDDQDTSYLFSGASQNINEGDPIPVCYGHLRIPGRQISFEIRNEDSVLSNTGGLITNTQRFSNNRVRNKRGGR